VRNFGIIKQSWSRFDYEISGGRGIFVMSGSNDLTFIRCPSCRSLVPSVSSRCRMCGNSLRVEDNAQEGRADRKPSRVRQPTTSLTGDEADTLREDATVTEWQPNDEKSANQADELFGLDDSQTPEVSQGVMTTESQEELLSEDEDEGGAVEPADEMISVIESEELFDVQYTTEGSSFEDLSGGLTEFGDGAGAEPDNEGAQNGAVEDVIVPSSEAIAFFSALSPVEDSPEDTLIDVMPEDDEVPSETVPFEEVSGGVVPGEGNVADAADEPSFSVSPEGSLNEEEIPSTEKSGGHQDEVAFFVSLDGDHSHSAVDELEQRGEQVSPEHIGDVEESEQHQDSESAEIVDDSSRDPHPLDESVSQLAQQEEVREASNTDEKEVFRVTKQPLFEDASKGRGHVGNTDQRNKEIPEVKQKQSESEKRGHEGHRKQGAQPPITSTVSAPRLFGWLVSYGDPEGDAIELREGRVLVTGSSLKKGDLVIDAPSISTPHAMLMMSVENGFFIQDLISERGVWVRKKGDDTYHREDNSVQLSHGDWLRLGDLEFVVSLVAYVGVK
jgi:hypothetical protein